MFGSFNRGARSFVDRVAAAAIHRRAATLVFGAALVAGIGLVGGDSARAQSSAETTRLPTDRLIFMQIPLHGVAPNSDKKAVLDVAADLPAGSRIVALDTRQPGGGATNLTPQFFAAGRPELSFDGRHVLFVGKRDRDDSVCVWEIRVDGEGLRRVIEPPGECRSAIYLSTIYALDAKEPERRIAFTSLGLRTEPFSADVESVYTCRLKGTDPKRITFTPDGAFDPYLLSDGRLLFGSRHGAALFTVNTDGTDVFLFAPGPGSGIVPSTPCETRNGTVVYVESNRRGWDRGGVLAGVPRTQSLKGRRLIADDAAGLYHSPSALDDGRLLVSYRPGAGGTYGIYVFDPQSGQRVTTIFDAPEWHDVHAVEVRTRPTPAGRSSVVDERVDTGWLYCLDAYLVGTERVDAVGNRRIDRVRVIGGNAERRDGGKEGRRDEGERQPRTPGERVIGEAAVEPDGSFYLEVPARTPLRLQTLNAAGDVLQDMRSWIWLMPKEARGCIGCHEDRELTPPNRSVSALRKRPQRIGPATQVAPGSEHPSRTSPHQ